MSASDPLRTLTSPSSLAIVRHRFRWLLLLPLSLAGCSRTENHFLVEDDGTSASAEVHLCGGKASLAKHGWEFVGKAPVTCEGNGEVVVHLKDGRIVSCKIEYVTPGADQAFRFKLQGSECRSVGVIGFAPAFDP